MEAVFLKLLNMSIAASWLVVAVVLLRLVLKKAPKFISLILWALVGVRLVLPISLESVFSLIPSAQTFPSDFATSTTPTINSGIPTLDSNINQIIPQVPVIPTTPGGTQIFDPSTNPTIPQTPVPSAGASPLETTVFIASIVWIAGIAVMLLYALFSYIRLKLKVREAVKTEGNIMVCDHIASPFILGFIRPKIYIPSSTDVQDVYYVLAHENAHLKRRDHFWKPLGFFLLSVYWFNPVLWVAYILLCRDIELACDEKVIKSLGIEAKKPYSTALVNCSVSHRAITVCPLAFGEVGVKRRVKTVLNYKKPAFWIIIVAIIACAVVAVCFLTNPTSDDNTTTTTKAPDTTTTTKKPTTTTTTTTATTTTVEPMSESYDIAYKKINYTDRYGWSYEEEYNEKGLLVKHTEKNRYVEYEYDENGNVTIVTTHDGNGELLSTSRYSYEYEYYPDGTISRKRCYLEDRPDYSGERRLIGEYEYNEDGNLVYSDLQDDFWWKSRYEYDENGRLIKKVTDALSYDYTDTTVYEYDATGNPVLSILTTTQDPASGNVGNRTEYEYDEYGNVIKHIKNYEDGRTHTYTYEYEYGEDGVMETKTFYFNGELSSVTTYENPFKIYK